MIVAILHAVESADFLYLRREAGLTKGNLPLTICHLTPGDRQAFEVYRQQIKDLVEKTG